VKPGALRSRRSLRADPMAPTCRRMRGSTLNQQPSTISGEAQATLRVTNATTSSNNAVAHRCGPSTNRARTYASNAANGSTATETRTPNLSTRIEIGRMTIHAFWRRLSVPPPGEVQGSLRGRQLASDH
jgi:hypothetical protein